MEKITNHIAAVIALSLLSLLPLTSSAQWTPPSQAPTAGNVSAPLNVSNIAQTKSGGLLLNTGGAANGLIIQFGNMGLGTTSPSAKFAITALGAGSGRAFALANSSNVEKVTILDNGNVNISGDVSVAKLTALGGVQVGSDTLSCNTTKSGTLRWGSGIEVCDGSSWRAINPFQASPGAIYGQCVRTYTNYNQKMLCDQNKTYGPGFCVDEIPVGDAYCTCTNGWSSQISNYVQTSDGGIYTSICAKN